MVKALTSLVVLLALSSVAHDATRKTVTDWRSGMSFAEKLNYSAPLSSNVIDLRKGGNGK